MEVTSTTMIEAARKGIGILIEHQTDEGRYGDEDDINGYYKSPYPLRIAGEPAAASRCMNFVVRRFMTDEGDFVNSPTERTAGTYTRLYCQIYANFWLLRGACALNRFDLAQKIFAFMRTLQDAATGGAYYEVDRDSGLLDSNTTACMCLSGLMCGAMDVAVRAGDALLAWKDIQDSRDKVYLRWSPSGRLETAFDEEKSLFYVVDAHKPAQYYFQVGLPVAALAKLYQATGESRYLAGSKALYDFLLSCHPDVKATMPIGKLGWGSAILYQITRERCYKKTCLEIAKYYIDSQFDEGYWLFPPHVTVDTQPLKLTTDVAAEMCSWLLDYAAELE